MEKEVITMTDSDQTLPYTIVDLPPEIVIIILTLLNTSDILTVRKTCRTLCKPTYERVVWMSLLQEQFAYLPMPPDLARIYHHEDKLLQDYSTHTIEYTVVKAQRTADAWLRPRAGKPYKLKREGLGSSLMALRMFLDRWLVALYFEGVVHLYDTRPQDNSDEGTAGEYKPILRASLVLEMANIWTSYAASMDPAGGTLFLALSRSLSPHMVEIFEINLSSLPAGRACSTDAFHLIRTITSPGYNIVQAVDSVERSIVLSTPSAVEVIKWSDRDYDISELDEHRRKIIRVRAEDLEGLWNGIVAVRSLGSSGYLLLFKTRSLEIRQSPLSNKPSESMSPLKHAFSMTFREVSFSECSTSRNPTSQVETYQVTLFASDVIQGLFHYTVRLSIPSSDASELPPSLDVQLTGVYPLALGLVDPRSTSSNPGPPSSITYSANFSPSPTSTETHANVHVNGTSSTTRWAHGGYSDYASRGFLSTQALGPQGKRAIWVERTRSSTVREVHVWSPEPPWLSPAYVSGRLDGSGGERVVEMKRRVVYLVNSYDLRDDITHCSFGEVDGTIVLGHRSGDISIIRLDT